VGAAPWRPSGRSLSQGLAAAPQRQEAADLLGISVRSVDRYIKSGKIRSEKKWKSVYVNDNDIKNIQTNSDSKPINLKSIGKNEKVNTSQKERLNTAERWLLTWTNKLKWLQKQWDIIEFKDWLKVIKWKKIGEYTLLDKKWNILNQTTWNNKAKSISSIEKYIIEYRNN